MDTALLQALHACWFGELDAGFADVEHRHRWFATDPRFDEMLRNRFSALPAMIRAASSNGLEALQAGSRLWLAAILATDQLPRNICRGARGAYEFDPDAIQLARDGIAAGFDRSLSLDERSFFYMPFMHSESLAHQDRSVELFTQLRDETPGGMRHLTGANLRSAQQHRELILQFGRFPHRNRVLGRESTPEELRHLACHSSGFGQAV